MPYFLKSVGFLQPSRSSNPLEGALSASGFDESLPAASPSLVDVAGDDGFSGDVVETTTRASGFVEVVSIGEGMIGEGMIGYELSLNSL